MGSGKLLRRAIKKHGVENFEKTYIAFCNSEEEMNLKEAELVTEEWCASDDNYNLCPGGQGGWGYVNQHAHNNRGNHRQTGNFGFKAPIDRARHSERTSEGLRAAYATGHNPWLGRKHSQVSKEKMKNSQAGKQVGEKNSQFGKPRSEETKRKIAESLRKRKIIPV